jgi:hypothetical protein
MTRFKELTRIETAIEHENKPELQWALGYAQTRAQISPNPRQKKYWQNMERKLESALQDIADPK